MEELGFPQLRDTPTGLRLFDILCKVKAKFQISKISIKSEERSFTLLAIFQLNDKNRASGLFREKHRQRHERQSSDE